MSQVTVTLERNADKVVGIIKSAYGFSSKDKAIQFIIMETGEEIIERTRDFTEDQKTELIKTNVTEVNVLETIKTLPYEHILLQDRCLL